MITIAFLVCENGFGHFKRCAKISNGLVVLRDDIFIKFFCEREIIQKQIDWDITQKIINNPRIQIIDSGKTVSLKKDNKSHGESFLIGDLEWLDEELIKNSDIVISDNITKILKIRPDSILMGSFLWEDLIKDYTHTSNKLKCYYNSNMNLLRTHKPTMITLKDMTMPFVIENTVPFYTSWVAEKYEHKRKKIIKNVLIMGGGTGMADDEILSIVREVSVCNQLNVFTSKTLAKKVNSEKISMFDFSHKSFSQIDLMICRPGIGSLTDAVTYGIPVFAIGESNNIEIQFNLKQIEKLNIGRNIVGKASQMISEINSIQENGDYHMFQKNLKSMGRNGLNEIINYINNRINTING